MPKQDVEFHPAADIFPMMSDAEAIGLLEDIEKNGLQEPIKFYTGKILDGRNRYLACLKLGIEDYEYEDVDDEVDDPVAYVLSHNLHRRHLTDAQRAMIGARTKEYYEKEAKERQKRKPTSVVPKPAQQKRGKSRDAVGVAVGVDGKQVDQASKVQTEGTPELIAAVDAGKLKMQTAANAAKLPVKQQREIAASDNPQKAAQEAVKKQKEHDEEVAAESEIKIRGVGTTLAREAVDKLKRIPKNDALRKRGFQIVMDWIKKNK